MSTLKFMKNCKIEYNYLYYYNFNLNPCHSIPEAKSPHFLSASIASASRNCVVEFIPQKAGLLASRSHPSRCRTPHTWGMPGTGCRSHEPPPKPQFKRNHIHYIMNKHRRDPERGAEPELCDVAYSHRHLDHKRLLIRSGQDSRIRCES
jgi:hypothetical protein